MTALMRLGVRVAEAPASQPRRPGGAACFAEPSAGELVVDGRKLVGSAQLRERGAMLQHGSILIDDDQPRIASLAAKPLTPAQPAATLRACLGRAPAYDEVRDALLGALAADVNAPAPLDAGEAAEFATPHRNRFKSAEWTWRS
jgi:lipoate-protein ligase A